MMPRVFERAPISRRPNVHLESSGKKVPSRDSAFRFQPLSDLRLTVDGIEKGRLLSDTVTTGY